jgi:hypothetical protein
MFGFDISTVASYSRIVTVNRGRQTHTHLEMTVFVSLDTEVAVAFSHKGITVTVILWSRACGPVFRPDIEFG